MSRTRSLRSVVVFAAVAALTLTACGNNAEKGGSASGDSGSSGSASQGKQPDMNGDGKVVIGVLSPGDLNDHGYYESFVVSAQKFADKHGWKLIKVGNINPADALEQARNMCRQHVDMVALAASELADAIPASEEDVCKGTAWYVPTQVEVQTNDHVVVSRDFADESLLAAGYAMGLLVKPSGKTSVGFVTGPQADFTEVAVKAFQAGIREVIPDGKVIATYTGDFNDSALAVEATKAQLNQGIGGLYPYLGGATDASAKVGAEAGIPVATPGTDRCNDPNFAMSVIFDPGEYFAAALQDFADGKLPLGGTREWHLGKDPLPTVKLCKGTPEQNQELQAFMEKIGKGEIDTKAEVERLGS